MIVDRTLEEIVHTEFEDRIHVTMTFEEAAALQDVLAHVGGNPITTRRRLIQPLFYELQRITGRPTLAGVDDLTGTIRFGESL